MANENDNDTTTNNNNNIFYNDIINDESDLNLPSSFIPVPDNNENIPEDKSETIDNDICEINKYGNSSIIVNELNPNSNEGNISN